MGFRPTSLSRRRVVLPLAGAGMAIVMPKLYGALAGNSDTLSDEGQPDAGRGTPTSREGVEELLRPLFTCSELALWHLAVDVFQYCVLRRLRSAQPPLRHAWLAPGGVYGAQWIWDTMFVVDLLSHLPNQTSVIRGIFKNYWEFQARWNAVKPSYSQGFIANYIAPNSGPPRLTGRDWLTFPAFSQRRCLRGAWNAYSIETTIWH